MPRRGVYMLGRYPRYMSRAKISIMSVRHSKESLSYKEVLKGALEDAERAGEPRYQVIQNPFTVEEGRLTWRDLDLLGINRALVVSMPPENPDFEFMWMPSLEIWIKVNDWWVVDITTFVGEE